MSTLVLLLANNSTVQTLTNLALSQSECRVDTVVDSAKAAESIKDKRPQIVLVSKEFAGINPAELCKSSRASGLATRFILLAAAGEQVDKKQEKIFDRVLYPPFKSTRLREAVLEVLNEPPGGALESSSLTPKASDLVFLDIENPVRRKIVEKILVNLGSCLASSLVPTVSRIITDKEAHINLSDTAIVHQLELGVLYYEDIAKQLKDFEEEKKLAEPGHISQEEQTNLAASIAAAVFKSLLVSPALAQRDPSSILQEVRRSLESFFSLDRSNSLQS